MQLIDEWEDDGNKYQLADKGNGEGMRCYMWHRTLNTWVFAPTAAEKRLAYRMAHLHIDRQRVVLLAGALARVVSLLSQLLEEAPAGFANLAKRCIVAVKGVAKATGLPLEKWGIDMEGVEEDPETAAVRDRLGLPARKEDVS